jgi:NAD(P)-dependent dehydrogenase (short-subunit alcohol dehydrogenase family)
VCGITRCKLTSKPLDGQVAVITCGNSGVGLATARRFAAEGAKVVNTGRRQPELGAEVPLGRMGTPDEIAEAAVFLAFAALARSAPAGDHPPHLPPALRPPAWRGRPAPRMPGGER